MSKYLLKRDWMSALAHSVKKYFDEWNLWEIIWLFSFTVIILTLSILWKDTWYGTVASLTGIWCVVLTAKGKISNYYFGIVNVILYAVVAYQSKFYGEVMLNILYFLPMTVWSIFLWKKHKVSEDRPDDVKVITLKWKERILWFIGSVLAVLGYTYLLYVLKGNLPWVDSITTIASVVAMIILARRAIEQWILWIFVDILTVIMWVIAIKQGAGDITILIMWIAYLINAIYGYINWVKLLKDQKNEKR
jgi:nicotinamide mononucleotide transporter